MLKCINILICINNNLLPRWRSAAPIQHAILAGDKINWGSKNAGKRAVGCRPNIYAG